MKFLLKTECAHCSISNLAVSPGRSRHWLLGRSFQSVGFSVNMSLHNDALTNTLLSLGVFFTFCFPSCQLQRRHLNVTFFWVNCYDKVTAGGSNRYGDLEESYSWKKNTHTPTKTLCLPFTSTTSLNRSSGTSFRGNPISLKNWHRQCCKTLPFPGDILETQLSLGRKVPA